MLTFILGIFLITAWMLSALYMVFVSVSYIISDLKGAPFVPNDDNVIKASLKLSKLSEKDTLVDLGSGNGKVLFEALNNFKAKKVIGYEISPWPYFLSVLKKASLSKNAQEKVELNRKSIFNADFKKADVIYVYLFPKLLKRLVPTLLNAKKENKNLRIVSCVFQIEGIRADKSSIKAYHKGFRKDVKIYLYQDRP